MEWRGHLPTNPARLAPTIRSLKLLDQQITQCDACTRLVHWREEVAVTKRKAYMKAYDKAYRQTPEYKAYNRARYQTPERKACMKAYYQRLACCRNIFRIIAFNTTIQKGRVAV